MIRAHRHREHSTRRRMALWVLCAFLLAKGFVPAGFMPSDGSAPGLYMLCPGDPLSALLLTTQAHDSGPHHHPGSLAAHPDHHHDSQHELSGHQAQQALCVFVVTLTLAALLLSFVLALPLPGSQSPCPMHRRTLRRPSVRILPAVRAPPTDSIAA